MAEEDTEDIWLFGLPDELSLYLLDFCTIFSKYVLSHVSKTTRRLIKDPALRLVRYFAISSLQN
jgi:hypothetical protein